MTKYDIIFESLQEKVNSGVLTLEDAEILNDVAYEKYSDDDTEYEEVLESVDDEGVTYEQYLDAMEEELFGEASKEEADAMAKDGLKKRQISQAWNLYHADIMGNDINSNQVSELNKMDAQLSGKSEMSPADRKRNIRAAVSNRNPHANDTVQRKQRVANMYDGAMKIVDEDYSKSKKRLFTKKRREKEHEQIKKEYMADRTKEMKKIIKEDLAKKK